MCELEDDVMRRATAGSANVLTPEDLSFAAGACRTEVYEARRTLGNIGEYIRDDQRNWFLSRIAKAEARADRFQRAMAQLRPIPNATTDDNHGADR